MKFPDPLRKSLNPRRAALSAAFVFAALFVASGAHAVQPQLMLDANTAPPTTSPEEQAIMQSLEVLTKDSDFVDIGSMPGVKLDLRYASENNFLKKNLYGGFNRCFLHKIAAEKLKNAATALQAAKPGYQLLIFDGLRPRSVQKTLFAAVVKTPQEPYVADPAGGSVHNFGFAIDLSVIDSSGKELDMGTPFDTFNALSEPALEEKFLKAGKLTPEQVENRRLLRRSMTGAGFLQLADEWWHYDALPKDVVRKAYKIIE